MLQSQRAAVIFLAGFFALTVRAEEIPKVPVPKSPFIPVIYRYADAMLEHGRDTHGAQKTGLFLSALDRKTLGPLTHRPAAPEGVPEGGRVGAGERPLTGANLQHDENLLRLLYMLSELSGKPKYREAADVELKWFLQDAASPTKDLFPWSAHRGWDAVNDRPIFFINDIPGGPPQFFRPWMLWDRCFELTPEPSKQFALKLWERQNVPSQLRVDLPKHERPRQVGFYLRTWAVAHAHTKDAQFLSAIGLLLERLEKWRHPKTGLIEPDPRDPKTMIASALSLAIDCDGAAHRIPDPLASRLRAFGARQDEIFCALPQDLKKTGGFITEFDITTGAPHGRSTPLWSTRDGRNTTAQIGLMCVSRYENTGRPAYRDLIHAAADTYLKSMPANDEDVWPRTIGHVISLQLAAWRSTSKQIYFDRARTLGNFALEKFFDQGPLPRASLQSDHYETITGADTLALALVELHLEILHITAVRYPPNTIDR